MAKLSDEQRKQLEELQALADSPDEEDFEVEIGAEGNYARVPYSKGRSWLQRTFGIDLDPEPEEEAEEEGKPAKGPAKAKGSNVKTIYGRRVS